MLVLMAAIVEPTNEEVWIDELKIVGENSVWVIVLMAAREFVLVLMAAIVDPTNDDVWIDELKMIGENKLWVIVLMAAREFVLVFMAAIVEATILEVCNVLLKMSGVIREFWKRAIVPVVEPKILILLPKFPTPSVDIFAAAVTLPYMKVERYTFKEDSAKISCVKFALENTDIPVCTLRY